MFVRPEEVKTVKKDSLLAPDVCHALGLRRALSTSKENPTAFVPFRRGISPVTLPSMELGTFCRPLFLEAFYGDPLQAAALINESNYSWLRASSLPKEDFFVFGAELEKSGWLLLQSFGPKECYIPPMSFDDYLSRLSKSSRKKARKLLKTLDIQTESPEEIWKECLEVERQTWKASSGLFAKKNLERTLRILKTGRAQIYTLRKGKKLVAWDLSVVGGNTVYLWNSAFLPEAPKNASAAVLVKAIKDSLEEGKTIEFLGHPSDFKVRWSTHMVPRIEVRAFRRNAEGRLFLMIEWLAKKTKSLRRRKKSLLFSPRTALRALGRSCCR